MIYFWTKVIRLGTKWDTVPDGGNRFVSADLSK